MIDSGIVDFNVGATELSPTGANAGGDVMEKGSVCNANLGGRARVLALLPLESGRIFGIRGSLFRMAEGGDCFGTGHLAGGTTLKEVAEGG